MVKKLPNDFTVQPDLCSRCLLVKMNFSLSQNKDKPVETQEDKPVRTQSKQWRTIEFLAEVPVLTTRYTCNLWSLQCYCDVRAFLRLFLVAQSPSKVWEYKNSVYSYDECRSSNGMNQPVLIKMTYPGMSDWKDGTYQNLWYRVPIHLPSDAEQAGAPTSNEDHSGSRQWGTAQDENRRLEKKAHDGLCMKHANNHNNP